MDSRGLPVSSIAAGVREHVPLRPGFLARGFVDLGTVGDAVTQTTTEGTAFDAVDLVVSQKASASKQQVPDKREEQTYTTYSV